MTTEDTTTTANVDTAAVEVVETKVEASVADTELDVSVDDSVVELGNDELEDTTTDDTVVVKEGDDVSKDDKTKETEFEEFKLPAGFAADPELMKAFNPLAKEFGLNQEQAQKLIDLQVKSVQKALSPENIADQVMSAMDSIVAQQKSVWSKELKSDKDIGGAKLDGNIKLANQALSKFGSPEFKAALKESGWSSNPHLVKMLVEVGKVISEDSFGDRLDNSGESVQKSPQAKLYPKEAARAKQ
jgi:hypothetical protein